VNAVKDTTGQEQGGQSADQEEKPDSDLNDMLQELRILLQGAQVLTAFLIILPFNQGFERIDDLEKWIYIATFTCSVVSLVMFTAPAAQHRIERPLKDREKFKNYASKLMVAALVPASLALVLSTQLVVSQVLGFTASIVVSLVIALVLGVFWWVIPLMRKPKE
jgi:hypothetical protein